MFPKKKTKSLSKYKKELDSIFSKYIRERDKGECYTCGLKRLPKEMQAGHFVPRQYLATRFDEINVHCQCYSCNMLYNGQPSAYALRLERDYGKGTVERLEASRQVTTKLSIPWYQEKIQEYTKKLLTFSI